MFRIHSRIVLSYFQKKKKKIQFTVNFSCTEIPSSMFGVDAPGIIQVASSSDIVVVALFLYILYHLLLFFLFHRQRKSSIQLLTPTTLYIFPICLLQQLSVIFMRGVFLFFLFLFKYPLITAHIHRIFFCCCYCFFFLHFFVGTKLNKY